MYVTCPNVRLFYKSIKLPGAFPSSLNLNLDYILLFATIPETVIRLMVLMISWSTMSCLSICFAYWVPIKVKKASHNFITHPTQVVLPLSPNHGLFGNDSLYSKLKISLETLFSPCLHHRSLNYVRHHRSL